MKEFHPTIMSGPPGTPGPAPGWSDGEVNTSADSLALIEGEGGQAPPQRPEVAPTRRRRVPLILLALLAPIALFALALTILPLGYAVVTSFRSFRFGQPVAIILVDIWEWTPFMFLILLAGIQSLPQEPFEAARVDGAGPWSTFRYLTLPMLRPVIVVAVLIRALDAFTVFDQVFVLTQGGPGMATGVSTLMVYKTAFRFSQFGYAAAMAVTLLILVLFLSAAISRSLQGQVRQVCED